MDSGKRIVKVRCDNGCVEQIIFYCEETDAAKAWNFRAKVPASKDPFDIALDALADYQNNWDTGLVQPYAESERIAMECAVEAVRGALDEARGTE